MTAAARHPASPYARRLVRERGYALELIVGSGPGGRIVAADVEAFVDRRAAVSASASVAAVSAFAVTVDLTPVRRLLNEFGGAELSLTLDDMLVRAAALALAANPPGGAIAWESGGGADRQQTIVANAHEGLLSGLHATLANGASGAGEANGDAQPRLSMRRIARGGIRPTALALLPGAAMRLVVSADETTPAAEGLLAFDAATVSEDAAADLLARFRNNLETPLRLLA